MFAFLDIVWAAATEGGRPIALHSRHCTDQAKRADHARGIILCVTDTVPMHTQSTRRIIKLCYYIVYNYYHYDVTLYLQSMFIN